MLRRTVEMLNRLHFRSEIDTLVGSLPLGWKQKLAFSIATLHRPEVVFLDEPTGGVDPVTRRQFWEMIYEAASGGTTVFVTTHYMDEAEYCSRVSIMVDGKVKALGSPAELKKQYAVGSMDEVFRILARSAKRGTQSLYFSIDHDRYPRTIFRFIHIVRSYKNSRPPGSGFINHIPKLTTGNRVHSSRRFVEKNHLRAMQSRNGKSQLLFPA
jgi:ABC-type multidrug transport system ATPase subunit